MGDGVFHFQALDLPVRFHGRGQSLVAAVAEVLAFGPRLGDAWRRAQLTQRELGAAVGYSETYITRLEGDTRQPDPVGTYGEQRVLRAPADGELVPHAQIGDSHAPVELLLMHKSPPIFWG